MKTAIIYARVSTVRQADDGLPVESQIEQCQVRAASLDATVVRVFRDDGISGRTSKRPGFEAAIDFCETHHIELFVCWSTSRFARNRLDAALHKRMLERMGTRLVYASQEFGEGDDGWLAEAITEVIDEQYSRQISKDTRRSMAKNAADGFFNGGRVPFGYRTAPVGKRRRLEIEPGEAHTVRLIYRWSMEGGGAKDIAVRLNQTGISRRGRRWDKAGVSSVLKSRANIGQLVYRVHGQEVVTQAHEPIVSEEEFMRVQDKIASRKPANVGGGPRSQAIFTGILRCGYCGDAMTTETATGRGKVRYQYYNCRSWLKSGGCANRRVKADGLDDWLMGQVLDRVFTPDNLREIILEMKSNASAWARDRDHRLAAMESEMADINRRLGRLYESVEAGAGLELSDIAPRMRELRARQDALKIQMDEAACAVQPTVTLSEHEIESAALMFRSMVEDCENPGAIRSFMAGILHRAVITGREVRLEYFPERLVKAASGGSQCEVRWLPDPSTLRTTILQLPEALSRRRAA